MINWLLALWIAVGAVHVGVPLGYFVTMKRVGARRDYHLSLAPGQQPNVSILIPTYNEAAVVASKLSNVVQSSYPSDKMELIVIDSASTDGTAKIARNFLAQNHLKGLVVEETKRSGKSGALNLGLTQAAGELVCISDAECTWRSDSLSNAVKYFSDPTIGAVSGVHDVSTTSGTAALNVEGAYRSVYRMLRVAESKLHSTPVGEGEIQLFRRSQLSGFDPRVGGDDTCASLCMVEKGLRAISAEDVVFYDPAPSGWRIRFTQKIRRGQHVLQAFLKHKKLLRGPNVFSRLIFPMEFFIYVFNPMLFPVFLIMTSLVMITIPVLGYIVLAGLVVCTIVPSLRTSASTYLSNNITMLAALLHEARGNKQLVWTKIEENRRAPEAVEQPIISR
jgi:poly-beta-1,6-N-acetyl-D-glucosamine synthase